MHIVGGLAIFGVVGGLTALGALDAESLHHTALAIAHTVVPLWLNQFWTNS